MKIQLKGNAGFLRCLIPEELPEPELWNELEELRAKGSKMLFQAPIVLHFEGRKLSQELICSVLSRFVWPVGARVISWIAYDMESQNLLLAAGLPQGEVRPSLGKKKQDAGALLLRRAIRSGQRIEHVGTVIVASNVHEGAEILCGGHVVVLGRLRGLAHAGMDGDTSASISARSFETRQVRIASKTELIDEETPWWKKPVTVSLENDSISIEEWPL